MGSYWAVSLYVPHSLAMALASSVLPHPGGPKRSTPIVDDKPYIYV